MFHDETDHIYGKALFITSWISKVIGFDANLLVQSPLGLDLMRIHFSLSVSLPNSRPVSFACSFLLSVSVSKTN